ncbi:hypothetical protein DKX38_000379 [Salix brachista]|uniref:Uncharacterized protein n=1 Tax=Salix brachista TaxID=2182728 RepID=A0A5N5P0P6_9ROSI|nr:hypothetical protein DKX38_000379 [Salix brachista]
MESRLSLLDSGDTNLEGSRKIGNVKRCLMNQIPITSGIQEQQAETYSEHKALLEAAAFKSQYQLRPLQHLVIFGVLVFAVAGFFVAAMRSCPAVACMSKNKQDGFYSFWHQLAYLYKESDSIRLDSNQRSCLTISNYCAQGKCKSQDTYFDSGN